MGYEQPAANQGMPANPVALAGVSTPLSGLAIAADVAGTVVAVLAARLGNLSADLQAGAAVNGNGSTTMWLTGTAAQVNAALRTVSYLAEAAGTDDLSIVALKADGTLAASDHATIQTVALATPPSALAAVVVADHGTMVLSSRVLDGPAIEVREPSGSLNPTSLVLDNATVGARSRIAMHDDNPAGAVAPRLALAGRVEVDGALSFAGNATAVSLARGATLANEGTIAIGAHSARFTGTGRVANDGLVAVTGDGTPGSPVRVDVALDGSGTLSLDGGASVELGGGVGGGQTVRMGTGANALHLGDPARFAGTVAGFARGDLVVLDALAASAIYSNRPAEGGAVVTVMAGGSVAATIRFADPEAGTAFRLGADAAGHATLSLVPASVGLAGSVAVYRFFDAATGTQLLAQGEAERDAIGAHRPDLRYEGLGMRALAPTQTDANASAVYRFFDTADGTHFLTASATERDAIIASRPDMAFEAGSTMFEHATAQSGDVPVYRFFDGRSGGHFFTADAGERASLLATRPDMSPEGIAFYAPAT